jgi:hypothetical protein
MDVDHEEETFRLRAMDGQEWMEDSTQSSVLYSDALASRYSTTILAFAFPNPKGAGYALVVRSSGRLVYTHAVTQGDSRKQ